MGITANATMKRDSIHLISILFLLFSACSLELRNQASMLPIDSEGWHASCVYTCEATITDSLSFYHVDITGRLRHNYRHDSLSVIMEVTAPSGDSFCDTLTYSVAHIRGTLWEDFRIPYCSHVCFSQTGTWQFSFRQNMDTELLTGVVAIGVYLHQDGKE
ncbi:MAG: gliding motility lipoprotein GldH [Bacteroidales bacterium]|nr:gliding motility lipoprotein GldH [Bacteroidales bacterium]